MKSRTIAVFTGNRAEYGLQVPVLRAISKHPNLKYQLLVSGAHLDDNFGKTLTEIVQDGFEVAEEIKIAMIPDQSTTTAKAISSGINEICKALERLKPDILLVYADRFEGFAAVIAGTQMNIPTAHIEGGDITEGGALDDSVRHAMTKLAHVHFTTNLEASNRILAMGEESWRVHTVGFPAIDLISEGDFANASELRESLGISADKPLVLFTQHSVTTEYQKSGLQVRQSLSALARLANEGVQILLTYPNNDVGGAEIIKELERYRNHNGFVISTSLGRYKYHGILALAKTPNSRVVCAGNSSSGIKETPAFGCPTINIGSRQEGRLRGKNVIDTGYEEIEIYEAISTGLHDDEFREICRSAPNPYGVGDAGVKIASVLAGVPLGEQILRKKMTNTGQYKDGWYR